jgi:hypothetical protein
LLSCNKRDLAALGVLLSYWLVRVANVLASIRHNYYSLRGPWDDLYEMIRSVSWVSKAINEEHLSPFFSPLMNYPLGLDFLAEKGAWWHLYLAGALASVVDLPLAINLVALGGTLASLLGAYVLFRWVSKSRVSGVVLAIGVVHTLLMWDRRLPDIALCNLLFALGALGFWWRYVQRGDWLSLVLAALAFGLACGAQLYYGLALGMLWMGMMLAASLGLSPRSDVPPHDVFYRTLWLCLAGALAALVALWPVLQSLTFAYLGPAAARTRTMGVGANATPVVVCCLTYLAVAFLLALAKARYVAAWWIAVGLVVIFSSGWAIEIGEAVYWLPSRFLGELVPAYTRFVSLDRLSVGAVLGAAMCGATLLPQVEARFQKATLLRRGAVRGAALLLVLLALPQLGLLRQEGYQLDLPDQHWAQQSEREVPLESEAAFSPELPDYLTKPLNYLLPIGSVAPPEPLPIPPVSGASPEAVLAVGFWRKASLQAYFQAFHWRGTGFIIQPPSTRPLHLLPSGLTQLQDSLQNRCLSALSGRRDELRSLDVAYVLFFPRGRNLRPCPEETPEFLHYLATGNGVRIYVVD